MLLFAYLAMRRLSGWIERVPLVLFGFQDARDVMKESVIVQSSRAINYPVAQDSISTSRRAVLLAAAAPATLAAYATLYLSLHFSGRARLVPQCGRTQKLVVLEG